MRTTVKFNEGWQFHRGDFTETNYRAIHANRFKRAEWMRPATMGYLDWASPKMPGERSICRTILLWQEITHRLPMQCMARCQLMWVGIARRSSFLRKYVTTEFILNSMASTVMPPFGSTDTSLGVIFPATPVSHSMSPNFVTRMNVMQSRCVVMRRNSSYGPMKAAVFIEMSV